MEAFIRFASLSVRNGRNIGCVGESVFNIINVRKLTCIAGIHIRASEFRCRIRLLPCCIRCRKLVALNSGYIEEERPGSPEVMLSRAFSSAGIEGGRWKRFYCLLGLSGSFTSEAGSLVEPLSCGSACFLAVGKKKYCRQSTFSATLWTGAKALLRSPLEAPLQELCSENIAAYCRQTVPSVR